MPAVARDGVGLRYETAGDGHPVAFLADAGFGPWLWGWQHRAVAGPFTAVVPAQRGTDGSEAGPVDVDVLAADLDAVLRDAGVDRAHLVGAGLGGAVALRYAREYGRARKLALLATTPDPARVNPAAYEAAFQDPAGALGDGAPADLRAAIRDWHADEDSREAFEAGLTALRAFDAGPLHEVQAPALVVHGLGDDAVPAAAGRALADALPRGTFAPAEGGHLAYVEHARAVNDRLLAFLEDGA